MQRVLFLAFVLALTPFTASAQFPALIADTVSISTDGTTLIASGNVEILSDEGGLRAAALEYNRETDRAEHSRPACLGRRNRGRDGRRQRRADERSS